VASIRKLGDKKYRIVYDAPPRNGKRRQMTETLVGVTKAKAEAILADRKRSVTGGRFVADLEMALNDVFDRFMEVKSKKCAATTPQRYDGLLRTYLRPRFGKVALGKLKAADLVSAYALWSRSNVTARTVLHAHDLMRNALNRAVKWGMASRSVADLIDTDDLPRAVKPESVVLDEAETAKVLGRSQEAAPAFDEAGVSLSLRGVLSGGRVRGLHRRAARRSARPALVGTRSRCRHGNNLAFARADA